MAIAATSAQAQDRLTITTTNCDGRGNCASVTRSGTIDNNAVRPAGKRTNTGPTLLTIENGKIVKVVRPDGPLPQGLIIRSR